MAGQCRVISDRRFESERNPSDHRLLLRPEHRLDGVPPREMPQNSCVESTSEQSDRKTEIAVSSLIPTRLYRPDLRPSCESVGTFGSPCPSAREVFRDRRAATPPRRTS